jgi:hypothetical protein
MSTTETKKQKGIFSKILVAIDGSKQSMDATYYAINVSNKFNAELYAIHVVNDPAYVDMFSFGIYDLETPTHRSEVIEINQMTPTPDLSAEKVLVEVKAAGINPIDWKIRESYMQQMIHLQFPSTLGMDFSGVIKQVGEDVSSDFKQGDEAYGKAGVTSGGSGAFAELALTNVTRIAHKPKTLNHLEAAALLY